MIDTWNQKNVFLNYVQLSLRLESDAFHNKNASNMISLNFFFAKKRSIVFLFEKTSETNFVFVYFTIEMEIINF